MITQFRIFQASTDEGVPLFEALISLGNKPLMWGENITVGDQLTFHNVGTVGPEQLQQFDEFLQSLAEQDLYEHLKVRAEQAMAKRLNEVGDSPIKYRNSRYFIEDMRRLATPAYPKLVERLVAFASDDIQTVSHVHVANVGPSNLPKIQDMIRAALSLKAYPFELFYQTDLPIKAREVLAKDLIRAERGYRKRRAAKPDSALEYLIEVTGLYTTNTETAYPFNLVVDCPLKGFTLESFQALEPWDQDSVIKNTQLWYECSGFLNLSKALGTHTVSSWVQHFPKINELLQFDPTQAKCDKLVTKILGRHGLQAKPTKVYLQSPNYEERHVPFKQDILTL